MAEGMTQIELAAFAVLALVAADDGGFEPHGVYHDLVHRLRVGTQPFESRPFDQLEERLVADDSGFDRFRQSGANLPKRQRREERRVADDELRLGEDARHILISVEIDAVLAADARIDVSQQRGRDEPERSAAHIHRRDESRDIGHDAASDAQQKRRTVGAAADQLAANRLDGLQCLVLFARLHADRIAALEKFGTTAGDIAIRQYDHPSCRQQMRQLLDRTSHHDTAASGNLQRITHH